MFIRWVLAPFPENGTQKRSTFHKKARGMQAGRNPVEKERTDAVDVDESAQGEKINFDFKIHVWGVCVCVCVYIATFITVYVEKLSIWGRKGSNISRVIHAHGHENYMYTT